MPGESPTPKLSDFESNALLDVAVTAAIGPAMAGGSAGGGGGGGGGAFGGYASEEDERKAEEEERQRIAKEDAARDAARKEAQDQFVAAVNERIANAYRAGADAAVDRADRNNFNARSITLYLVVLAVVSMPAIAMIIKLNPQTFGSYIAPVTGIAGTVVGYWFGTLNRSGKYTDSNR